MEDSKQKEIEDSIAVLEGQRIQLGNAVVEPAISAMKKQLEELKAKSRQPRQQRKLLTILFVDVVDSTSLLREKDPEEKLDIMDTALQLLAMPVEEFGGRVTRFMGDGFLAVFGLPVAKENDPEMAVRSGLGILTTTQSIAKQLEKDWNLLGFQVRVGINTGLVVTGGLTEAEDTLMGNAVNLAARLESSADPSTLLISQYTYQHVKGLFDVEKAKKVSAKGFDDPIQTYQVKKSKAQSFRPDTRGIEGVDTPMVGREVELTSLQKTYEDVVTNNSTRIVTIVGDAGLGKSRLLFEFENWLPQNHDDYIILRGRATLEVMNLPYRLLKELFSSHFGVLEDDSISTVTEKIKEGFAKVFDDDADLDTMVVFIGQLLGYRFHHNPIIKRLLENPKQIHDQAFMYLANYLRALGKTATILVFLDDIQWADESSLDTFIHLEAGIRELPLLLIGLARPSLYHRRPLWGNESTHSRIDLSPLTTQTSIELVQAILEGIGSIPIKLKKLITENSDGNPYYLEEMIRMLIEDQVIEASKGKQKIYEDRLTQVKVPATLTGILQARLDNLSAEERKLLQQASVIGRTFWDDIIKFILESGESLQANELENNLASLVSKELILRRETSVIANANEYYFKNAILREVTYESVLKRTRQRYHGLVADWLIQLSPERKEEIGGIIAGHLEKAGRTVEAIDHYNRAADIGLANYALNEAYQFYIHGLELTPKKDLNRKYDLLFGMENILHFQGKREKQKEILNNLQKIANELSEEHKMGQILIKKAWFEFWTGDLVEMNKIAMKALSMATGSKFRDLEQNANYALAWSLLQIDKGPEALKHAQTSLKLAQELGDIREEGNSHNALGMIKINQGDFFGSLEFLEGFLSAARQIGDKDREGTALNNIGVSYTRLGDFEEAEKYYRQQYELAIESDDLMSTSTSLINLAWIKALKEEWKEALDFVQEGLKMKRQADHVEATAEGLMWLGNIWQGLNNMNKAKTAYLEALEIRRSIKQDTLANGALAGLARCSLAESDKSKALEYVEEILKYLKTGSRLEGTWEPLRLYLTCIQVLEVCKDDRWQDVFEEASEILESSLALITEDKFRKSFVENFPWHKELIEMKKQSLT